MKRILIADDHETVRSGLRAVLEERAGWEVVAEAHDGKKNCTRRNDYTGIAEHAMSLVGDETFFDIALDQLIQPGLSQSLCPTNCIFDRFRRRTTVADDGGPVDAEKRGAAKLGIVNFPFKIQQRSRDQGIGQPPQP